MPTAFAGLGKFRRLRGGLVARRHHVGARELVKLEANCRNLEIGACLCSLLWQAGAEVWGAGAAALKIVSRPWDLRALFVSSYVPYVSRFVSYTTLCLAKLAPHLMLLLFLLKTAAVAAGDSGAAAL